jgi:hypothetical protein
VTASEPIKVSIIVGEANQDVIEVSTEAHVDKINIKKGKGHYHFFAGPIEMEIPGKLWEQLVKE